MSDSVHVKPQRQKSAPQQFNQFIANNNFHVLDYGGYMMQKNQKITFILEGSSPDNFNCVSVSSPDSMSHITVRSVGVLGSKYCVTVENGPNISCEIFINLLVINQ